MTADRQVAEGVGFELTLPFQKKCPTNGTDESTPIAVACHVDAMQALSFCTAGFLRRLKSPILWAKWRATVDEDGQYAFAVAL